MITYLSRLTSERDSLTQAATDLANKASEEERDFTETEATSLASWQARCAEIDTQLTQYNSQAESQRAYARLRDSLTHTEDEQPKASLAKRDADPKGWGDVFVESDAFQGYQGVGSSGKVQVPGLFQTRATIDLAALAPLQMPYQYQPVQKVESTPLLDAIGHITTSSNVVEWVAWVPAAVAPAPVVAEGALKPEMDVTAQPHSDTLDTYAHWKGITRQALEDIPQIRSIVETRLRKGLAQALNGAAVAALNGGTYAGVSDPDLLTGIRLGLAAVQDAGYGSADTVVLNPADLASIDIGIMHETNGGPALNTTAWGLRFIPVSGVASGTAYVGDLDSAVQMFDRGSATVFMTDSHADYFVRNIILLLAETRALAVVSEPGALVEVTATVVGTASANSKA